MNLIEQLIEEEGFKPYAYTDSLGYLTIGHGILIEKGKGGITEGESRFLNTTLEGSSSRSMIN